MRIVITGASGNVGTATLLALGAEGRHQLVGVSRRTPSRVPPYSWAEWAPIDIADLDAAQRLQLGEGWETSHDREACAYNRTAPPRSSTPPSPSVDIGAPALDRRVRTWHGRTVDESWPARHSHLQLQRRQGCGRTHRRRAEERLTLTRVRPALIFQDAAASEVARYFLGPLVPNRLYAAVCALRPVPRRSRLPARTRRRCRRRLANDRRTTSLRGVQRGCRPADRPAAFREIFGGVGPALPPKLLGL